MSWLKMTSKSLYLMKGGTNEFLNKIDLIPHGIPADQESKLDIPTAWLEGSDVPRVIVIDVDSIGEPNEAKSGFKPDDIFKKILKRSDWNASNPLSRFEIVDRPKFLVIHHTEGSPSPGGIANAKLVAKGIQDFHMAPEPKGRGWSDIGYSFLNTVDGFLVEGRFGSLEEAIKGNAVRGAHAGTDAGNRAPGIASEGNFMTKEMDSSQWNSLVDICTALCQSCDIDPAKIMGHRDFVSTDCPGNWLYSQLDKLKKEVAQKMTG
jgi:N-acetylmuramoyl-L-alanine amidase